MTLGLCQFVFGVYCKYIARDQEVILEILRALSHSCCLFHLPQGFQEKCYQALYQTALLLEEAGCCFTQSCVSGKNQGIVSLASSHCESHSVFKSVVLSSYVRNDSSKGHGAALTLL